MSAVNIRQLAPGSRSVARSPPAAVADRSGAVVFRALGPGLLFVLRSRHLAPRRPGQCRRVDRARAAAAVAGPAAAGARETPIRIFSKTSGPSCTCRPGPAPSLPLPPLRHAAGSPGPGSRHESRAACIHRRPGCCDAQFLREQHPDLITIRADAAAAPLLALLPGSDSATVEPAAAPSGAHAPRVYLIDPLGNLMMSYAADAKSKGMLEDMKRLLRLSSIG